ncbi:hypothetical protein JCM10207_005518 [Rhodosporidiobolus poonsookiae]
MGLLLRQPCATDKLDDLHYKVVRANAELDRLRSKLEATHNASGRAVLEKRCQEALAERDRLKQEYRAEKVKFPNLIRSEQEEAEAEARQRWLRHNISYQINLANEDLTAARAAARAAPTGPLRDARVRRVGVLRAVVRALEAENAKVRPTAQADSPSTTHSLGQQVMLSRRQQHHYKQLYARGW